MLKDLKEKVDFMVKMFQHNSGALIQPKWVSVDVARQITGMGKTWLLERQIRAGEAYNPNGLFRTRIQDKKVYFLKKDLEAFENWQKGESGYPSVNQLRKAI